MKPLTADITIQAPLEATFARFANIPQAHETITAILNIEILSGQQVGVGTRWRETRIMFGREATEEMWISQFEPNRRYLIEAESHGAHYFTEFRFSPVGQDATHVEVEFTAKPLGLLAKMMSPLSGLMAKSLQNCLQQDLMDVKQKLEQPPE